MKYAVLGTGLMGSAVARGLAQGGHTVQVWNRTFARSTPLEAVGAVVCSDVASAIGDVDAVVLMLLDGSAALSVLDGQHERLRGTTLINLMTGTPGEATELAAWAADTGARYLDGAIECYPSDIGAPGAVINCAGNADAWDDHQSALRQLAGRSAFVGTDPGAANILDAALAGTFHSVALGALCETFAFLRARGIDPSRPEVALDYWLDFLKEEALSMAQAFSADDLATEDATLSVYLAAVRQWRQTMLDNGQRASLMTAHLHNLEIAEATGAGDLAFLSQTSSSSIQRSSSSLPGLEN